MFDPKNHIGNKSAQVNQQPEPPQHQEQDQPQFHDSESDYLEQQWGRLMENEIPATPPEWLNEVAPEYTPGELSAIADRSEEVAESAPAEPTKPKPGYLANPRPSIPTPFVQHIFNMRTINEINAGPGVGKTTLLSMLAACVATGKPFLNSFLVKKGISVFFTEDAETVTNCLAAWELEWGVSILDSVLIYDKPAALTDTTKVKTVLTDDGRGGQRETVIQLDKPVWGDTALRQIREIKEFAGERQVCMVVYDSKSFHLSSSERNGKALDENSNDDQQFITFCGYRFALALKACGIFIPHVSKEAERSGNLVLESRGGGAAKGAVWKTFSLTQDKTKNDGIIMASGKRRGGGISQLLRLRKRTMQIFPDEVAAQYREEYLNEFDGSIHPEQPLTGLATIDPLYCGGYLNECEIVTEEQLAAELEEKLDGDKAKKREENRSKPDPRTTRPSNSEQDVLDMVLNHGGRVDVVDCIQTLIERTSKSQYQIKRSVDGLVKKGFASLFVADGVEYLTATQASPPPLNER